MIDEDELIADCTELLGDLVADGSLELATRYGSTALAASLAEVLTEDIETDLEEWLLERDEVVELFVDSDTLDARVRPIITRLEKGDGEPKWNDALAAAIIANPDDVHARLVFGDWLEQEGDPRGELIAVQAAIAEKREKDGSGKELPAEDPLKRRELSLLERFRTHFFGDLTRDERTTFLYGYFDTAMIDGHELDRLATLHSARFLRHLSVSSSIDKAGETLEKTDPRSLPTTLTTVKIGTGSLEPQLRIGHSLQALPRLDHLELHAVNVAIEGGLEYPHLSRLAIHARDVVKIEGAIKLPALTELTIEARSCPDFTTLRAILAEPPPLLTTLRLHRIGGNMSELLRDIVLSRLLPQLKALDLRRSGLLRTDGPFLLENAKHFAHLERLDLRGTYVAYAGNEAALEKLCKDVALGYEGLDDDEDDEDDEYDEEDDEDEDDEGEDWEDPDLVDPTVDEPALEEEEEVEEEVEEERQEEAGVDRDAPVEEDERYDGPVE